jgi:hypothetical protein
MSGIREFAVEIDTYEAALLGALWEAQSIQEVLKDGVRRAAGQRCERVEGSGWGRPKYVWTGSLEEALEAGGYSAAEYLENVAKIEQIREEIHEHENVWLENGCWNRAYLVIGSGDGHVHSSRNCSTCFATTQFEWITNLSAADESEIVEAAGRTACTVCYPSAPADVLNREPSIVSKDQAEKAAAKAERDAAKAARDAKKAAAAPTASGEELALPDRYGDGRVEWIKTERTAVTAWNDSEDSLRWDLAQNRPAFVARLRDRQEIIERALAEKHGITQAEMRSRLLEKFAKRRVA